MESSPNYLQILEDLLQTTTTTTTDSDDDDCIIIAIIPPRRNLYIIEYKLFDLITFFTNSLINRAIIDPVRLFEFASALNEYYLFFY